MGFDKGWEKLIKIIGACDKFSLNFLKAIFNGLTFRNDEVLSKILHQKIKKNISSSKKSVS